MPHLEALVRALPDICNWAVEHLRALNSEWGMLRKFNAKAGHGSDAAASAAGRGRGGRGRRHKRGGAAAVATAAADVDATYISRADHYEAKLAESLRQCMVSLRGSKVPQVWLSHISTTIATLIRRCLMHVRPVADDAEKDNPHVGRRTKKVV